LLRADTKFCVFKVCICSLRSVAAIIFILHRACVNTHGVVCHNSLKKKKPGPARQPGQPAFALPMLAKSYFYVYNT